MKKTLLIFLLIILPATLLKSQQLLKTFGNNHVSTTSIEFTADGRLILIGGYAKFYDVTSGMVDFRSIPKDSESQMDYTFDVIISPDNRNFLLTKVNRIEIWDMQSRKLIKTIRDNQLVATAVCYSSKADNIIYLTRKGELIFINPRSWDITSRYKISVGTPVKIALSPSGNSVLIGNSENELFTFDFTTQQLTSVRTDCNRIEHIEFPADGKYVAISSADGRIWLAKYPSMELVRAWQAHTSGLAVIAFYPTGEYLASGGKDKMIRIWSIPDCSLFTEWKAHENPLASLAFSPSGEYLASGSLNNIISIGVEDTRIWSFKATSQNAISKIGTSSTVKETVASLPSQQKNIPAQKRIALVIGNGSYLNGMLANPENDARDFKNVLVQLGFDVLEYENLTQNEMKKAIDDFGNRLKQYDVGLFYYAGHGIQFKGFNYLIPVDASLSSEQQVEYDCVQADRVLGVMEASGVKVNIMILDACRNNPFERSWSRASSGKGLAYMNAPGGTLIAYATAPGSTASDGSGKNGLYTAAILESIKIPDITILQMFQNVRSIVSEKSNKLQIPWESTSLTGDFYFIRLNR